MEKVEKITPYTPSEAKDVQVRQMFDTIAPAYDLMNRTMTFGLDRRWLKKLVKSISATTPKTVADLATGTGDVAFAIAKKLPEASIIGLDLSEGMLAKAREKADAMTPSPKIHFACADCLATGLEENSQDAVTIAYGIRNFVDIAGGLKEFFRILRQGGTLAILELSTPEKAWARPFYKFYTKYIIPALGALFAGDRKAYAYLPASIAACPQRNDMKRLMEEAGFSNVSFKSFTFGVCTLYTATK